MPLTTTAQGTTSSHRFPCLRALRSTDDANNRAIVLFVTDRVGTVVQGNGSIPLGYYSNAWADGDFDDFYGTVTLTCE